MTERDKIFGRIREALKVKAHHPHRAALITGNGTATSSHAREWLPPVGETSAQHLVQFQNIAQDLKASVNVLKSNADVVPALKQLSAAEQWNRAAIHRGSLTGVVADQLGITLCHTDRGYDVRELEGCDVGITECDALVAQTGSVLVTSRSAGGRALSVLPPHHVVLARKEQLVPDLPEAFAVLKRKYSANYPSFISFITGPSRTGDIERILVLGAHGPKKLSIFIW